MGRVEDISDGLTANIVRTLETSANTRIKAHVVGKSGARVSEILRLPAVDEQIDLLIVTMGVNDTVGMTVIKKWRTRTSACVEKFGDPSTKVFITGVPAMHQFPALPAPLSWFLGVRSKLLNASLEEMCHKNGWQFVPANMMITPELMATDGYHPNVKGYRVWGESIGQLIGKNSLT